MIVTISREYGACGLAIAELVGEALGYEVLSDQIPAEAAARLGTSREEVDSRAQSPPPLGERMLRVMQEGTADTAAPVAVEWTSDFDESVRSEIERAMRERAARGNVVVLGRVGNAVLAGMPGLVRAFIYADRGWRIERIMETFGFNRGKATAEVDRLDIDRKRFTAERYKVAWGDRRFYDVIVDSSRLGITGAAETIVAAVRASEALQA
jgi:cytidylate kinase